MYTIKAVPHKVFNRFKPSNVETHASKYPEETATYNIIPFIDSAEELVSVLSEQ